jgi:hypothetical protein
MQTNNQSSERIGAHLALFGLFVLLSLLAIWLIPKLDPSTEGPGSITVLGVGLALTLFTGGVLYFGVIASYKLPTKLLLFAFLYNTLIIIVKFTIWPLLAYRIPADRGEFAQYSGGLPIADPLSLAMIAAAVLLLYYIVFFLLYRHFKYDVEKSIPSDKGLPSGAKVLMVLAYVVLFCVIMLTGGAFIVLFLSALIYFQYLSFVFSGIFGALIAAALIGAVLLVKATFKSAAQQAIAVRNATIFVSFFWVGASFLFLYHALWVVYVLILATLWPLRVVLPK